MRDTRRHWNMFEKYICIRLETPERGEHDADR